MNKSDKFELKIKVDCRVSFWQLSNVNNNLFNYFITLQTRKCFNSNN